MTRPTIYPTGFAGDATDYLKAKVSVDQRPIIVRDSVTVAAATTAGTIIGLHPIRANAKIGYGTVIYVTDLDTATNVTLDVGITYESTANTSDGDCFIDGTTLGVAAGWLPAFGGATGSTAGIALTAAGDGWVTVTLATGPTTTSGTIYFEMPISYGA